MKASPDPERRSREEEAALQDGRATSPALPPVPLPAVGPAAVSAAGARLPALHGRYDDFLPEAEAISRRRHSPFATVLIGALCALVAVAAAWMHLARIDDVVSVPAVVRAVGGANVQIEARVPDRDIGGITVGQDASVTLRAYDPSRYGALRGTVVHIAPAEPASAAAATPPASVFLVRIDPDKDHLGDDPRRHRLLPGMTARVSLVTGERSILEFLTAGLRRTAEAAPHGR